MPQRISFHPTQTLPLSSTPLISRLSQRLRAQLGISSLFHLQYQVLTHLLSSSARASTDDLIICSPTGTGKTLAYVLPILQLLHSHTHIAHHLLRAIVVVPTRDLAAQVTSVFQALVPSHHDHLHIVQLTGANDITIEMTQLSSADIIVATPGRLVDHVQNAPSLSFNSVRFLVLDESDRLLQESYDHWLELIMPLFNSSTNSNFHHNQQHAPVSGLLALAMHPHISSKSGSMFTTTSQHRVRKLLVSATQSYNPTHMVHLDLRRPTIFEIISNQSTLHHDPLDNNQHSQQKYNLPPTLTESGWIVNDLQQKPAALLALLGWIESSQCRDSNAQSHKSIVRGTTTLIFTNSVQSAHRLSRLLEFCQYALDIEGHVLEMSGELSTQRRQQVINFVKQPSQDQSKSSNYPSQTPRLTIVCSDVLSRGMDIFNVDNVINYDTPVQLRTYVHRAGRTARAGRSGHAMTLLLGKQVHHFRVMVHQAQRGDKKVKTVNMQSTDFFTPQVKDILSLSLTSLRRILTREKLNLIPSDHPLPTYVLYELIATSQQAEESWHPNESHKGDSGNFDGDLSGDWEDDNDHVGGKRPRSKDDYDDVAYPEADGAVSILDGRTEVEDANDTLSDVLFAQIGRNLVLSDLHR